MTRRVRLIEDISYKSLKETVINSEIPVVLLCWASWCLPCKQTEPMLVEFAKKYKDKCSIIKINVDRNPKVTKKYNIKGLPTIISFVKGQEIERKTSAQTDQVIKNMIDRVLKYYVDIKKEEKIIEKRLKDLGYM